MFDATATDNTYFKSKKICELGGQKKIVDTLRFIQIMIDFLRQNDCFMQNKNLTVL